MLLCVNVRKGGVRLFYAFSQASENRPEDRGGKGSEGPGGRDDAFFKSRRKYKERGGEKEERDREIGTGFWAV